MVGPTIVNSIGDHGHKLITIEENTIYENHEIDPNEESWPDRINDEGVKFKG